MTEREEPNYLPLLLLELQYLAGSLPQNTQILAPSPTIKTRTKLLQYSVTTKSKMAAIFSAVLTEVRRFLDRLTERRPFFTTSDMAHL